MTQSSDYVLVCNSPFINSISGMRTQPFTTFCYCCWWHFVNGKELMYIIVYSYRRGEHVSSFEGYVYKSTHIWCLCSGGTDAMCWTSGVVDRDKRVQMWNSFHSYPFVYPSNSVYVSRIARFGQWMGLNDGTVLAVCVEKGNGSHTSSTRRGLTLAPYFYGVHFEQKGGRF